MIFEKYIAGEEKNAAYENLNKMMSGFDTDQSYANMIRHRICGAVKDESYDVYYVAHENGQGIARHWMGFGKHRQAVGNWGNFFTIPEQRGNGIGKKLLDFWYEDFKRTEKLADCFMCTTSKPKLVELYSRFGFRPAIRGADSGPLYMPVADSPDTFLEFAENYYQPSPIIFHRPATIGYRHEIDCLFRFYCIDNQIEFGINKILDMDTALLYYPKRTGMLFTENGCCVGWSFDGVIQMHPLYKRSEIICELSINNSRGNNNAKQ